MNKGMQTGIVLGAILVVSLIVCAAFGLGANTVIWTSCLAIAMFLGFFHYTKTGLVVCLILLLIKANIIFTYIDKGGDGCFNFGPWVLGIFFFTAMAVGFYIDTVKTFKIQVEKSDFWTVIGVMTVVGMVVGILIGFTVG